MENTKIEKNEGEIKIHFDKPVKGKFTFAEMGIKNDDLFLEGGNLRLVIELGPMQDTHLFKVPTVEFYYREKVAKTGWVVEFNGEVIQEKTDPGGNSTVILLNRDKMSEHIHRHENNLIVHGDFPEPVQLNNEKSYINILA